MKMKTDIKTIASLVSSIVWCDGEYSEVERETTDEIIEALELPADEFKKLIEEANSATEKMNDEQIAKCLEQAAAQVDEEEVPVVFEVLMQMALCDGVLTGDEVDNLLSIADALGMDQATAVLLLCDMVKEEPELEISFA